MAVIIDFTVLLILQQKPQVVSLSVGIAGHPQGTVQANFYNLAHAQAGPTSSNASTVYTL